MQSTDQRAYDRGVTVFSPDGRLYQVEYAREAVEQGSATVGVRTENAIVFATQRPVRSSLLEAESVEKLHDADGRLGIATAGHVADGRRLVEFARTFAQQDRLRYGEPPGVETVAKAVADHVQESTQTGGTRPYGAALLVGGVADGEPRLFEIDPSGTPYEWAATAVGSGSRSIRDRLEDAYEPGLDTDSGIELALDALADEADGDLSVPEIGIATMDADGFEAFDRDRREAALSDAGVGET